MRRATPLLAAALLALTASPASAATIRVPQDQPTIGAAVAFAAKDDTVRIDCGVYYEHDIRVRRTLTILGASDSPQCVTVDAESQGRVFILESARDSWIEGMTLRNGSNAISFQQNSYSVSVRNCVLMDNTSAAISAHEGAGNLVNCQIRGNDRVASISSFAGLVLQDCLVIDNTSSFQGLVYATQGGNVTILRTIFAGNTGADCVEAGSSGTITVRESTFFRNSACFRAGSMGTVNIQRSLFAFNVALGSASPNGTLSASCIDSYGHVGDDYPPGFPSPPPASGNFSADPLFCDAEYGKLGLRPRSPCLPGNHPDGASCGLVGALGEGCGEFPLVIEGRSWGHIKSAYR
ncbi:MAG TPA: right-handed parallel beta-helix repeat-containing protein [bacterium]|nr:right-handed parallel beta-helix repeat-containing protein [bacterium]